MPKRSQEGKLEAELARIVDSKKPKAVLQAAQLLDEGRLVVIPTDTVYGVAARSDRPSAIDGLFQLKGRPREIPIAILVRDVEQASSVASLSPKAMKLAEKFWPGALTIVVRRAAGFEGDLGGDRETVGVRAPDHPVAQDLLRLTGPLAVTSANRSGEPTPSTVDAIAEVFGEEVSLYLDAGPGRSSASTVVAVDGGLTFIRAGALGIDVLERALNG